MIKNREKQKVNRSATKDYQILYQTQEVLA